MPTRFSPEGRAQIDANPMSLWKQGGRRSGMMMMLAAWIQTGHLLTS